MGFAHLEVARGRVTRPLGEVAIAIRPMGRGKVPTVQIFLAPDTLRASGLLIGDRVDILVGDGDDEGLVRLVKAKKGEGDVRIRTASNVAIGFVATRLVPRLGIDKFSRVEIGFDVVAPGCIQIALPWFTDEEDDFRPAVTPGERVHIEGRKVDESEVRVTTSSGDEDPWSDSE